MGPSCDVPEHEHLWYCRIAGRLSGPITSEALMELARQGKISETDQIRLGINGQWMKAGELESLFPEHATEAAAAHAAADILSHQGRAQLHRQVEPETQGGQLLGALRQRVRAFLGGAVGAAGSVGDVARSAAQRFPLGRIALGMGVVALVVAIAVAVRVFQASRPPGTEDAYQLCQTYLTEWRELRDREAAAEEWEELQARSGLDMFPLVKALEKIAGSRNRVAQQLLWACRDTWPRMLEESQEEVSPAERQFEERLKNVDRLLQGETVYAKTEDREMARKAAGAARTPPQTEAVASAETDWLMPVIIGFDAILIIGFIVWWRRRGSGNALSSTTPV